jgi:hypothetical protein
MQERDLTMRMAGFMLFNDKERTNEPEYEA